MRLRLFCSIGPVAIGAASNVESNLTYFGTPRLYLDGVLPTLDIAEGYIRESQGIQAAGTEFETSCSADKPCLLGSCCNKDGHCGYLPEHCAPDNCVADCNAKAACGEFSTSHSSTCPLNACCSCTGFCGFTDAFCRNSTSGARTAVANDKPSCGKYSGTASRKVAYYQSWNIRTRPCDKVRPNQLNTYGITHLVLAFASIDPATFQVKMMNPADESIYKEFLDLPSLQQKWIGIGGFEFSDPGATRTTWSDMVSTQENRKKFIDSLKQFLDKWNFTGVDIDWEWPGSESRGGSPNDGQNQVELMKEMRQRFGSGLGLSVVIPAQYDYLKNLNIKGLEEQADWLTMLTYDLHGQWDASIPGLGPKIKPHTDLQEIDAALGLLWSSNLDTKKINMGVANYGRGYTVAEKKCVNYNCAYTGPSKQGSCTLQPGILSQCEISRILAEKQLSPSTIPGGAEAKEVTWDDQYMSWDDANTAGKKTELANDRCLGGTALWAIDYSTCPGGGVAPVPAPVPVPGPGSSAVPLPSVSAPVSPPVSSAAPPNAPSPTESPAPPGPPQSSQVSSATSLPPGVSLSTSSPQGPSGTMIPPSQTPGPGPMPSDTLVPMPSSASLGSSAIQSGASSSVQGSTQPSASQPRTPTASNTPSNTSAPTPVVPVPVRSPPVSLSSDRSGSSGVASSSPGPTPLPGGTSSPISSLSSSIANEPSSADTQTNMPTSSLQSTLWTSSPVSPSSSSAAAPPMPSSGASNSSPGIQPSASSSSAGFAPSATPPFIGETSIAAPPIVSPTSSQASSSGMAPSAPSLPSESSTSNDPTVPSPPVEASSSGSPPNFTLRPGESTTLSSTPVAPLPSGEANSTGSAPMNTGVPQQPEQTSTSSFTFIAPPPGEASSAGSAPINPGVPQPKTSTSGAPSLMPLPSGDTSSSPTAIPQLPGQTTNDLPPGKPTNNPPPGTPTSILPPGGTPTSNFPPGGTPTNGPSTGPKPTATTSPSRSSPSPSVLPWEPWCPDECRGQEWCKIFCDKQLDPVPPIDCWEHDWCMIWWGFPRLHIRDDDKDKKEKKKQGEKCQLLGCGCGWMGLPWGPGCPGNKVKIPWPYSMYIELFGLFPAPCLFWGCDIGGFPTCGFFGCGGWCFGILGCEPCPPLICKFHPPKTGPPPKGVNPFPKPGKPKNPKPKPPVAPKPTKPVPNNSDPPNNSTPDPPGGTPPPNPSGTTAPPSETTTPDDDDWEDPDDDSIPPGHDNNPKPCKAQDIMTAIERIVVCKHSVDLSSAVLVTTISSTWPSTTVATSASTTDTCGTLWEYTLTGCNVVVFMTTTTVSTTKGNSISSSTPAPACTRAPFSLDDDEGNNIPEENCQDCWDYFDDVCIPKQCKPDDPEYCAHKCLSDMCLSNDTPRFCRAGRGKCKHESCPEKPMGPLPKPFAPTLTFPNNGPTLTVTLPSSSSYTKTSSSSSSSSLGSSSSSSSSLGSGSSQTVTTTSSTTTSTSSQPATPSHQPVDKKGVWKILMHLWMNPGNSAKMEWSLVDPNGNIAQNHMMPVQSSKDNIKADVYSDAPASPDHAMPFTVHATFIDPTELNKARVYFQIDKEMPHCYENNQPCKPNFTTENRLETTMFWVNSCWQFCPATEYELLHPSDLNCDDMNVADWEKLQNDGGWKRDFTCQWKGF